MTDIDNAFEKFQSRIAQLQADYNSSQQTVQRLHDLVRYKRSELLNDDLISMDEYAELAQDHAAVARLEGYDSALKKIRESSEQTARELREKLANERERCARVAEGHRCFNTANQRCMNCIDASKAIAARIRE